MTTSSDDLKEDYGISQFINHVQELELCLGAGHEEDRYELAMQASVQRTGFMRKFRRRR